MPQIASGLLHCRTIAPPWVIGSYRAKPSATNSLCPPFHRADLSIASIEEGFAQESSSSASYPQEEGVLNDPKAS